MAEVERIELEKFLRRDNRGYILTPVEAMGIGYPELGNMHIASLAPGAVRGNHYHDYVEWMLFLGGRLKFAWKRVDGPEVHVEKPAGDGPVMYRISPQVVHAIQNLDRREIQIVSLSDARVHKSLPAQAIIVSP